ncbi:glycosyltransferase family 2 protein [Rhodococcus sp. BP-349]|uniref:glycosyltransferase family 2 protein n=1 Tax=unclassified Rhodococcus (in: high G+C Gram-positive bacteria) TaxID=192944 RepID=UPI001C9A540E|nr:MULTISPECIES: glycosyltransferase family 2 protein [unclassified Rhodococcus (in: high G+C Gram-positive bacteria)]MBY6539820.1 glycosyltransferase family 2 protein [Rhodococcus sp. BP-363]MBY6543852.1 glycosyltransferase family 2 protein [Rhodococcus sp. BP-369]MBY6563082.1 glycosyltransferase family 2 protein [Rhodococcus sp. BP-370]MBY6577374.1 glycosyltransferase family 2 protein [Rhodococcus sp. BP-364]MBY6586675.1 glycosyltransferase family 2 protein [Rhodococcus sp. BP-358]
MDLPTLSLVVPAFNEEDTIGYLIESIRDQLSEFHEIIMVDNASTDGTGRILAELASRMPAVRVVFEPRPGVVMARNAGFDAADGDIICRLDADARAKPGWARTIREFFAEAAPDIGAGTGRFDQYDMPLQRLHKLFLDIGLRHDGDGPLEVPTLFGANMAIRRSTWTLIRSELLDIPGIFDDLDITLCVSDAGQKSVLIPGMEISASGRRMLSSVSEYKKFVEYMPATYAARGMHTEAAKSRASVRTMRLLHLLFWLPVRAWQPASRRYSLSQLISDHPQRVLPYDASR